MTCLPGWRRVLCRLDNLDHATGRRLRFLHALHYRALVREHLTPTRP